MFPTDALFFNFFLLKLKLPIEETNMSISDMNLDNFKALLQGAEGVTFGNEHTSTRTNGE